MSDCQHLQGIYTAYNAEQWRSTGSCATRGKKWCRTKYRHRAHHARSLTQLGMYHAQRWRTDSSGASRVRGVRWVIRRTGGMSVSAGGVSGDTTVNLGRLQSEILVRILRHLSIHDLRRSALVCKTWHHVMKRHAAELWKARCEVLGLLPAPDTVGVLAASAEVTRALARKTMREKGIHALASVYRAHYWNWVRQICHVCIPENMQSLCCFCVHPDRMEWVRPDIVHKIVERGAARPLETHALYDAGKLRTALCRRPPYLPLSYLYTGAFGRLDDILRLAETIDHRDHSDTMSYIRDQRVDGGIIQ